MKKGDDTEIIRLKNMGKSFREIGRLLGISHVAVRKRYLKFTKVTTQENPTCKPEKNRVTDQISNTGENLNILSNTKGYDNLKKSEILANFSQKEKNEDIEIVGNKPGYQGTVNTEPSAEPQYYIHRQTREIYRRSDMIGTGSKIRAELEPYFPPKYLRKINEPHKIFIWTLALGQKWDEFEPYHGPLPWKSKGEEG